MLPKYVNVSTSSNVLLFKVTELVLVVFVLRIVVFPRFIFSPTCADQQDLYDFLQSITSPSFTTCTDLDDACLICIDHCEKLKC